MSEIERYKDEMNGDFLAEVREIESLLSAKRLPSSSLDRDALLFQAGQAAAEARFRRSSTLGAMSDKVGTKRESARTALWSLASAVLAGSIVALVLSRPTVVPVDDGSQLGTPTPPRRGALVTDAPVDSVPDELFEEPSVVQRGHPPANAPLNQLGLRTRPGSLLTLRNQALADRLDDPWPVKHGTTNSASPPSESNEPKTISEMLRELSAT